MHMEQGAQTVSAGGSPLGIGNVVTSCQFVPWLRGGGKCSHQTPLLCVAPDCHINHPGSLMLINLPPKIWVGAWGGRMI